MACHHMHTFWLVDLLGHQGLQIDLTADEYIIGAVDLYLDILNMFLWLIICCLHCFETVLKG